METRIAKLKLDDSLNEDLIKEKVEDIEQECVSRLFFRRKKISNKMFYFLYFSGQLFDRIKQFVCEKRRKKAQT